MLTVGPLAVQGTPQSADVVEPLDKLLEEESDDDEESDMLQAHAAALIGRSRSFPELRNEAARIQAATAAAEAVATLNAPVKTSGGRGRDGAKEKEKQDKRKHRKKKVATLEALCIAGAEDGVEGSLERLLQNEVPALLDSYDDELLEASQQEFTYATNSPGQNAPRTARAGSLTVVCTSLGSTETSWK